MTRRYVGFWHRLFAYLIDALLFGVLMGLTMIVFYGLESAVSWEYVDREYGRGGLVDLAASWLLPAVLTLLFWEYKSATPGKMVISAKMVDADSGACPSPKQWIIRYLGYFVSALPLGLGFLWIAIDSRNQGWHDKLANTVVIFSRLGPETVDADTLAPADEGGPVGVVRIG